MSRETGVRAPRFAMGLLVAACLLLVPLGGCKSLRAADERVFSGRVEVNGSTCGASPFEPVSNAEVRLVFNDGSSRVLGHSDKVQNQRCPG
ncbi:MAG: hypothetical protein B7X11_00460 [Acidobacteria bacterium 37-65-4]|nr:MAG: hypothetical protein B7X11_00460 [Acidobacteria bacterium 37-65-4]